MTGWMVICASCGESFPSAEREALLCPKCQVPPPLDDVEELPFDGDPNQEVMDDEFWEVIQGIRARQEARRRKDASQ